MGNYELHTVLKKWKRDELTGEQAIGQILQLLEIMSYRVGKLEIGAVQQRPLGVPSPEGEPGEIEEGGSP